MKSYLNAFVILLTALSLLIGIIGFIFSKEILILLNTPKALIEGGATYLRINFLGILFLLGYNFIGTVFRSIGDSKTPLYFVAPFTIPKLTRREEVGVILRLGIPAGLQMMVF